MTDTNIGNLVNSRFQIVKKLGSGSFGTVYKGLDRTTNTFVAIKIDDEEHTRHENEIQVFRKLQKSIGFPKVFWDGLHGDRNVIVMEQLGYNLDELFDFCGKKFSLKTTIMIALNVLNRIEALHNVGIIHRDIKPDNFLIGLQSAKNKIYMVDFGLSKSYLINNEHIPYKTGKSFTGSFRYSSIRNHKGIEQSRRDDLESIGYMLIFFLKGELPWQGLKGSTKSKRSKQIFNVKKNTSLIDLCKDLPNEFFEYMKYCRLLRFNQKPNYNYLKLLFSKLFKEKKYELDYIFDWNIIAKIKKLQMEENSRETNKSVKALASEERVITTEKETES
jgi:serine/threonine protein kinase